MHTVEKLYLYFLYVANMNEEALEEMFTEFTTGVYYGWAQVGKTDKTVYPMVMSLGWNPYYKNEKRSAVSVIPVPFIQICC